VSCWSYYQHVAQKRAALSGIGPLFGTYQADAEAYIKIGVDLLKENYEAFVPEVFAWAEASAELALNNGDFNPIYARAIRSSENVTEFIRDPATPPDIPRVVTNEELAIEENYGRMRTLQALAHARWLLNGVMPLELWQQIADCHRNYYEANSKKWGAGSLADLLRDMVSNRAKIIRYFTFG